MRSTDSKPGRLIRAQCTMWVNWLRRSPALMVEAACNYAIYRWLRGLLSSFCKWRCVGCTWKGGKAGLTPRKLPALPPTLYCTSVPPVLQGARCGVL